MKRKRLLQILSRYALMGMLLFPLIGWTNNPDVSIEERYLTEVLDEISEKYQVFFTYNRSLLKDIKINFDLSESGVSQIVAKRVTFQTSM